MDLTFLGNLLGAAVVIIGVSSAVRFFDWLGR